jgi:formiminoglutamase
MSGSSTLDPARPGDLEKLRTLVAELDQRVAAVIKHIHKTGALPVVIGGGHNNSYGCLRGTAQHLGQPLNCINLDPHADFRMPEGRHSGNGFSYAKNEGYLEKYFVFGLHESYNSRNLIDKAKEGEFMYLTHDSIVRGDVSLIEALYDAIDKIRDRGCGLELDMDGIAGAPSSAQTPSGFTPEQARYFVSTCMKVLDVKYVHIAEGAPSLVQNGDLIIGKLISYLVGDICKAVLTK